MKYEIIGEPMPVVVCDLEANEAMITERGSMVWMSPNMKMETGAGGIGKAFGRMFSGESMFQNTYTAQGGAGMIAFASSFPGSIKAVEIDPAHPVVVQKSGFLASEQGVELSIFFQKKAGAGFFGGEGFIMQKLSGRGTAFLEVDGYAVEYELQAGQSMVVDSGKLAMMDATCTSDNGEGRQECPLRRRGPVQHRGNRAGQDSAPDHAGQRGGGGAGPILQHWKQINGYPDEPAHDRLCPDGVWGLGGGLPFLRL